MIEGAEYKADIRRRTVAVEDGALAIPAVIPEHPHHCDILLVGAYHRGHGNVQRGKRQYDSDDKDHESHHFACQILHACRHLHHGGKAKRGKNDKEYECFTAPQYGAFHFGNKVFFVLAVTVFAFGFYDSLEQIHTGLMELDHTVADGNQTEYQRRKDYQQKQ